MTLTAFNRRRREQAAEAARAERDAQAAQQAAEIAAANAAAEEAERARLADEAAAQQAAQATDSTTPATPTTGVIDYEQMKKAELLAIAEAASVEVTSRMSKAEIAAAIGAVEIPATSDDAPDGSDEGPASVAEVLGTMEEDELIVVAQAHEIDPAGLTREQLIEAILAAQPDPGTGSE